MPRKKGQGHKLTLEQVIEIRRLYAGRAHNGHTLRTVAKEFGIARQMVHMLVQGRTWDFPEAYPKPTPSWEEIIEASTLAPVGVEEEVQPPGA